MAECLNMIGYDELKNLQEHNATLNNFNMNVQLCLCKSKEKERCVIIITKITSKFRQDLSKPDFKSSNIPMVKIFHRARIIAPEHV